MDVFSRSRCLKLISGLAVIIALGGCLEKADEASDASSSLSLSGTFKSSCVSVGGTVVAGGTYMLTAARFGTSSGANGFEYAKNYYSDSSCSTMVFGSSVQGTFTVGAATTAPANGYYITYSTDNTYILAYGTSVGSTISSGCSSNVSWNSSGNNKLGTVWGSFSCAGMTVAAPGVNFYNVVVLNGAVLSTGATDGDNPGLSNSGSVGTTAPLNFTQ